MHKFSVYKTYCGAWVAEDDFGNTIWSLDKNQLLRLFGRK